MQYMHMYKYVCTCHMWSIMNEQLIRATCNVHIVVMYKYGKIINIKYTNYNQLHLHACTVLYLVIVY